MAKEVTLRTLTEQARLNVHHPQCLDCEKELICRFNNYICRHCNVTARPKDFISVSFNVKKLYVYPDGIKPLQKWLKELSFDLPKKVKNVAENKQIGACWTPSIQSYKSYTIRDAIPQLVSDVYINYYHKNQAESVQQSYDLMAILFDDNETEMNNEMNKLCQMIQFFSCQNIFIQAVDINNTTSEMTNNSHHDQICDFNIATLNIDYNLNKYWFKSGSEPAIEINAGSGYIAGGEVFAAQNHNYYMKQNQYVTRIIITFNIYHHSVINLWKMYEIASAIIIDFKEQTVTQIAQHEFANDILKWIEEEQTKRGKENFHLSNQEIEKRIKKKQNQSMIFKNQGARKRRLRKMKNTRNCKKKEIQSGNKLYVNQFYFYLKMIEKAQNKRDLFIAAQKKKKSRVKHKTKNR